MKTAIINFAFWIIFYSSFSFPALAFSGKNSYSDTTITDFNNEIKSIQNNGYDIVKSLPANYVTNGTIDYTPYIQQAINNHNILVFPSFPLLIDSIGLQFGSDSKVYFKPGSQLIMEANGRANYELIRLQHIHNTSLYYPNLVGDRLVHMGTSGEWGMGISIKSSSDIAIINPVVRQCWGDGIYIGSSHPGEFSKNIFILNAVCDSNRRNGISIISVVNLKLENPVVTHTYGTNPMSGIDIEPGNLKDTINNISIENAYTAYNKNAGISIGLSGFLGTNEKDVNINIIHPHDRASGTGLLLGQLPVSSYHLLTFKKMQGSIMIKNPIWEDNTNLPLSVHKYGNFGPQVQIINPTMQAPKIMQGSTKKYIPGSDEQNIKITY